MRGTIRLTISRQSSRAKILWDRGFARSVVIVACAGLALLVAGCNTLQEERLIEQGIGTELSADDIAESTSRLNNYLLFLCGQVSMTRTAVVEGAENQVICDTSGGWSPLVKAGFNDIDRRCDSYLAWLNSRRRNQNAILNQIHDTRTFTEALLFTTGVGATPLTIAGLAFGLASSTFTNYYSRLLFEIEKSTVEVLVHEKRLEYRDKFNIQITNQPDAVHILREYLLICTPFYIEDLINQRTRDSVAGNTPADKNDSEQIRRSIVAGALIGSIPPAGPRGPLPGAGNNPPVKPSEPKMAAPSTEIEKALPKSIGELIQKNLCVADTATFDRDTREAIRQAKLGGNQSGSKIFNNVKNEISNAAEVEIFQGAGPGKCNVDRSGADRGYQTAFEKFVFPEAAGITSLQVALARCEPNLQQSGIFDPPTRSAIASVKARTSLQDKSSATLDSDSYNAITAATRLCKR